MFRLKNGFGGGLMILLASVAFLFIVAFAVVSVYKSSDSGQSDPTLESIFDSESDEILDEDESDEPDESFATTTEDVGESDSGTQLASKKPAVSSAKKSTKSGTSTASKIADENTATSTQETVLGICGFQIDSHIQGGEINFPVNISGSISLPQNPDECQWNIRDDSSALVKIAYEDEKCNKGILNCEDGYRFLELQENIVVENHEATSTTFTLNDFGEIPESVADGTSIKIVFYEMPYYKKDSDTFVLPLILNRTPEPVLEECGFTINDVVEDDIVNFPVTIKGKIDNTNDNSSCFWNMSEGHAGSAQLYYETGDEYKILGTPSPIVVEDAQAEATNFTTTLTFNNQGIGLPLGSDLKIVFTDEDPSGKGDVDSKEIMIVLGTITPPKK